MSHFRVALLQMSACGRDQEANLHKGETFCRQARELDADLALFPEMWNVGYAPCPADPEGRRAWQAEAVGPQDDFFRHFRALASELEMAVALTYLERWEGAPRNTVSIFDRRGQEVLTYVKVHTCDFSSEAACTPGDSFRVADLELGQDTVRIGAMICYDREFPESARALMLGGAEVVLTPNACTLELLRIGQFQARSFENKMGLAMTNYATPDENGHSVAFDGMAIEAPDVPSRDMLLVEAGEDEGVFLAEFPLERLRAYRSSRPWANAYRKPRMYEALGTIQAAPPFVRPDSRR